MSATRRTITSALLACSIFISIFFSACADKIKSNLIAFEALDGSLMNSNTIIQGENERLYHSLEEKLNDPRSNEKAQIWQPKAKQVKTLSINMMTYIEELKSDLKNEAGLKTDKGSESIKESDKNAVMRLFIKKGEGEELYKRLTKYKQDIMAIDSQMSEIINKSLLIMPDSFDSSENKQADFTKIFFDDIPAIAALAMLSRFENSIKIAENKMVDYCDSRVVKDGFRYDSYSAIIVQSSAVVKANEKVEITAGVGAFSKAALPKIIINGMGMELNSAGAAIYSFNANSKPGTYKIPVKIDFIDEIGQKQTITKNIEYTVAGETKQ